MHSVSANSHSVGANSHSVGANSKDSMLSMDHKSYVIAKLHQRHKEQMMHIESIVDNSHRFDPHVRIKQECTERARNYEKAVLVSKNNVMRQRLDEAPRVVDSCNIKPDHSSHAHEKPKSHCKMKGFKTVKKLPPVSLSPGRSVYEFDDSSSYTSNSGTNSISSLYGRENYSIDNKNEGRSTLFENKNEGRSLLSTIAIAKTTSVDSIDSESHNLYLWGDCITKPFHPFNPYNSYHTQSSSLSQSLQPNHLTPYKSMRINVHSSSSSTSTNSSNYSYSPSSASYSATGKKKIKNNQFSPLNSLHNNNASQKTKKNIKNGEASSGKSSLDLPLEEEEEMVDEVSTYSTCSIEDGNVKVLAECFMPVLHSVHNELYTVQVTHNPIDFSSISIRVVLKENGINGEKKGEKSPEKSLEKGKLKEICDKDHGNEKDKEKLKSRDKGDEKGNEKDKKNEKEKDQKKNNKIRSIITERKLNIEDMKRIIPKSELDLDLIDLRDSISEFTNDEKQTLDLYSVRTAIVRMFQESVETGKG